MTLAPTANFNSASNPAVLFKFFLPTRDSAWAGPKIVLVPPYLYIYIYIFVCPHLEDHHAVYTRCIGRMHSLATTPPTLRKVGVASMFKMAAFKRDFANLSSSKIR